MEKQNRLTLIKEIIYYLLGILLIFGFVYLYWGHFTDASGPPDAILYIMHHWGMRAAIIINAAVFLIFIIFLPFRVELSGVQRECFQLLSWLYLPKCSVCLC